ncbi:hypothetical protein PCANB_000895 [Pneumocystis canis]|nr:hypothetical protein PCANB_000895 [Pneumocystis canis]
MIRILSGDLSFYMKKHQKISKNTCNINKNITFIYSKRIKRIQKIINAFKTSSESIKMFKNIKCYFCSINITQKIKINSKFSQSIHNQQYSCFQESEYPKNIEIEPEKKTSIIILPPPQQNTLSHRKKLPRGITFYDNSELLAVFDACVSTGDLNRAYILIDHLSHEAEPSFIIQIHNRYLQTLVDEIKETGEFESANKCFHNLEQKYNVIGDETTFALMLKAALYIKNPDESRITINGFNKLWRLKKKENIGKIFNESSVLTHQEMLKLFEVNQTH